MTALDNINIRRLVGKIKHTINESLSQHVFEPNDRMTRHLVWQAISGYLDSLKADRALMDYLVVCDETNNSPTLVDMGILTLDIFIKPVHPVFFETENQIHIHATVPESTNMATYVDIPVEDTKAARTMPPVIELLINEISDIELAFHGEEDGRIVRAEFTPETNITAYEYMQISQLQMMLVSTALAGADISSKVNPIKTIRRHNLERHFKFSEY